MTDHQIIFVGSSTANIDSTVNLAMNVSAQGQQHAPQAPPLPPAMHPARGPQGGNGGIGAPGVPSSVMMPWGNIMGPMGMDSSMMMWGGSWGMDGGMGMPIPPPNFQREIINLKNAVLYPPALSNTFSYFATYF